MESALATSGSQEPLPGPTGMVPVGEIDAVFRSLFAEHGDRVFSVALRLSGRTQEAEDLTAETFLQAYRMLSGFDYEQLDTLRPRPWLSAIVVDRWRIERRTASGRGAPARPADPGGSGPLLRMEPQGETDERGPGLVAVLATLPGRQRSAVVLRYVGGLPAAEVAEALGCPVATATSLVARARDRLRPAVPPTRQDPSRPRSRRTGDGPPQRTVGGASHREGIGSRPDAHDVDDRALTGAISQLSTSAPVDLMEVIVARWTYVEGPVEDAYVAFTSEGISSVVPASTVSGAEAFVASFCHSFGRPLVPAERPLRGAAEALRSGRSNGLRFDLRGRTDFEQAVLHATRRIPPGELRPYSWVAAEIRRPRAVRAVGTALGHNPVPLLIPCHRVIRADGSMGQYGGFGTAMKRRLLEGEGIDVDQVEALVRSGSTYVGDDTSHRVCLPTCHRLSRLGADRHGFRSLAQASASGYRPCPECRPVGG